MLGKGELAAHACDVLAELPNTVLDTVVPNVPEPDWDISLSGHVREHHRGARIVASGDWKDLEPGRCDLVVSVLYDKIIGASLIDATPQIVNCHPGRLPQFRGARPTNWALLNGERLHGVTIHCIDSGIDSGPILAEAQFSLWPDIDEVGDAWHRAMRYAKMLISDTLPRLERINPRPQDDEAATTHYMRDNHLLGDRSDWSRPSASAEA